MVGQTLKFACLLAAATSCAALPTLKARTPFGDFSEVSTAQKWYSSDLTDGQPIPANPNSQYKCFDGADISTWPAFSEWLSFDAMWQNNLAQLQQSNSASEIQDMRNAITGVSSSAHLDARLIFAIVMQESTGKVHVGCRGDDSNGDGRPDHCGLMQSAPGSVDFNPSNPSGSIKQMIMDGVYGVDAQVSGHAPSGWPGLLQYFDGSDINWVALPAAMQQNPYVGARLYNSGNLDPSGDINVSPYDSTTMSYANDVANRLIGWNGDIAGCKASESCPISKSTNQSPLRDPALGQCV